MPLIADSRETPGNGQLRLWLDDGGGRFSDGTATRLPAGSFSAYSIATGDVDADGDIDIVLGCFAIHCACT